MRRMSYAALRIVGTMLVAALISSTLQAQQTGGGTNTGVGQTPTGSNTSGGGGGGGGSQGTLQSQLGGMTTQGLVTDGTTTGGVAGANAASSFIGGNATDGGFVGGARETTTGSTANRQFRGITDSGVAGRSTQQQQSATPRQKQIALRVGFSSPSISQSAPGTFSRSNAASVQRIAELRPELAGVNVRLSPSGVATLTGITPDVSTSRLAANLIRLQPGVRSIDNQIEVSAAR